MYVRVQEVGQRQWADSELWSELDGYIASGASEFMGSTEGWTHLPKKAASSGPSTSSSIQDHSCGFMLPTRVSGAGSSTCSADLKLSDACMDCLCEGDSSLTEVPAGLLELLAAPQPPVPEELGMGGAQLEVPQLSQFQNPTQRKPLQSPFLASSAQAAAPLGPPEYSMLALEDWACSDLAQLPLHNASLAVPQQLQACEQRGRSLEALAGQHSGGDEPGNATAWGQPKGPRQALFGVASTPLPAAKQSLQVIAPALKRHGMVPVRSASEPLRVGGDGEGLGSSIRVVSGKGDFKFCGWASGTSRPDCKAQGNTIRSNELDKPIAAGKNSSAGRSRRRLRGRHT